MRFRFFLPLSFALALVVSTQSCIFQREIVQMTHRADTFWEDKQYDSLLVQNQRLIDYYNQNDLPVEPVVYKRSGIAAFFLGDTLQAVEWLNNVTHITHDDERVYYVLALGNRKIDNLSREITALENYVRLFPEGDSIAEMEIRLFQTYIESGFYDEALSLWEKHKDVARESEELLSDYFSLLQKIDAESEKLKQTAEELLKLNERHIPALEFLAHHHFWIAENRYQEEMEAYQNNRTHRQYAQLLRAFELLNEDFRIAMDFYKALYEIHPKPSYARSIGNIYLRFDNRSRANFYHSKAE